MIAEIRLTALLARATLLVGYNSYVRRQIFLSSLLYCNFMPTLTLLPLQIHVYQPQISSLVVMYADAVLFTSLPLQHM